jgi:hypothetical protein
MLPWYKAFLWEQLRYIGHERLSTISYHLSRYHISPDSMPTKYTWGEILQPLYTHEEELFRQFLILFVALPLNRGLPLDEIFNIIQYYLNPKIDSAILDFENQLPIPLAINADERELILSGKPLVSPAFFEIDLLQRQTYSVIEWFSNMKVWDSIVNLHYYLYIDETTEYSPDQVRSFCWSYFQALYMWLGQIRTEKELRILIDPSIQPYRIEYIQERDPTHEFLDTIHSNMTLPATQPLHSWLTGPHPRIEQIRWYFRAQYRRAMLDFYDRFRTS